MFLYYITDRTQFSGSECGRRTRLLAAITEAALCGVDFIQLREKDLSPRDLESLARESVAAILAAQSTLSTIQRPLLSTKLLINSRVDIAIAAGADGVHLRSGTGELPADEARRIFQRAGIPNPIIVVSCHTTEEVVKAESHGADFVVFGPVFAKSEAGTEVRSEGIRSLEKVCMSHRIPVLALGGVDTANARICIDAGAAGVAGIRLFQAGGAFTLETIVHTLREIRSA